MPKMSHFSPRQNAILSALPDDERAILLPSLERIPLTFKQVLQDDGKPLTHLWFVRNGVASMLSAMADGGMVEVATVGPEGVVGVGAVLGANRMAQCIVCQIVGEADRLPLSTFHELSPRLPTLNRLLLRSTAALVSQIAQGSACNRLHQIETRCARWLLMTHDRVEGDSFALTHEFLAQMLGVTRPSVTIATGILQKAGLIHYVRGQIDILDRERLEDAACECYWIIREEFERLISPEGSE